MRCGNWRRGLETSLVQYPTAAYKLEGVHHPVSLISLSFNSRQEGSVIT